MNRVFKTRWSIARQQYVVIDEHHTTKDRRKTLVAAAVVAVLGGVSPRLPTLTPSTKRPGS